VRGDSDVRTRGDEAIRMRGDRVIRMREDRGTAAAAAGPTLVLLVR